MGELDGLDHLALADVVRACAEQTGRFRARLTSDPRYCYELLRRAFATGDEDAIGQVYAVYLPDLAARARRHPMFPHSCQDADYFARVALSNFYRAASGLRFTDKFALLQTALAYLYACLHSAIVQDVRDNPAQPSLDADDRPEVAAPEPDIDPSDIWAHICALLADEADQRLAYQRFVLGLTPVDIVRRQPEQWASERAVSVALQRIRRRLRADEELRQRYEQE